ncbi:hypothetical protein PC111_g22719 [Phytophthora cactorum]|nr:hypothetical protein PC111_g22719 [Phytophthora cactorum]KAG3050975.1 hypothetical protein PC122_g23086 [Phytophthora cactorum]
MPKRDSNNGEMETASSHIYELPHGQNGQWTRAQAAVHSRCGTPAKICCWRVLSGCQRIGSIELEFHLLSLHRGSPSAEWK